MNRVDRGRDGEHLRERRDMRSGHHGAADRVDAHFLGDGGHREQIFDRRDRWQLDGSAVAPAGEQAIDLVKNVAAFRTRAR